MVIMTMNKLIMVITIAVLSQAAMGNDGDNPSSSVLVRAWQTKIEADNAYANGATLKNAEAVTERTKSEADRVYRKGVARRNELHQWSDAIAAFNSVKASSQITTTTYDGTVGAGGKTLVFKIKRLQNIGGG
jgi:hypothetical protein